MNRDPYGPLNPYKSEYLAQVIREVNYKLEHGGFEDENEPVGDDNLRTMLGLPLLKAYPLRENSAEMTPEYRRALLIDTLASTPD